MPTPTLFNTTWLIDTAERAIFSFIEAFVAALVLTDLSSAKVAAISGGTAALSALKSALATRRSGTISPASALRPPDGRQSGTGGTDPGQRVQPQTQAGTASAALQHHRRRLVAAVAVIGIAAPLGVLTGGGSALASKPTPRVLEGTSCGSRSAFVLTWGAAASGVSATGSARCSTNSPNRRVCMKTELTRYAATVARSTSCRTGGGSLSASTPVVNRSGPLSAYRAVQTIYTP